MSDKVMVDKAELERLQAAARDAVMRWHIDRKWSMARGQDEYPEAEWVTELREAAALAPASSERAAAGDTYAYAEDSESWGWEGGFSSREEAEREGREEYPDGFSTGRCRPATLKDVYPGGMAETLIDRIGAEDESGTPMEGYAEKVHELVIRPALGGRDTRLLISLEMALMTAFETWAAEHLPRPDWFHMEDVQLAPAPAVAE